MSLVELRDGIRPSPARYKTELRSRKHQVKGVGSFALSFAPHTPSASGRGQIRDSVEIWRCGGGPARAPVVMDR